MATQICSFACLTPAGGSSSIAMNVGLDPVQSIHWRCPAGSRGHLSWFLAQSGVQVLPNTLGQAMVTDGEQDTWVLDAFPNNPIWTFVGTNTGSNDHTVYLDFFTGPVALTGTGGGNVLAGFPVSDADIPRLWLA